MSEQATAGELTEEVPSQRVQEILETGARLFAEKGYDATSMRDISNAAGVSKALLYHHFSSKDDIYARIAFSATQHLNAFVSARIPPDGTAAEKLRAFMVSAAKFFSEHRSAWIAASNAFWSNPDQRLADLRIARRRQFESSLRDIIREGVASGEFNDVDPASAGRLVLSGINWMHRWYDPDKELSAEQIVDEYADILLAGIAKTKN